MWDSPIIKNYSKNEMNEGVPRNMRVPPRLLMVVVEAEVMPPRIIIWLGSVFLLYF